MVPIKCQGGVVKVGDLVMYKGITDHGVGIVTWVQDTDSVTYQIEVDWGNGGRREVSYLIETISESR